MKKVILTMLTVAAMSTTMQAKTVKTEIPVNGKCNEMCKPRIEKAAKSVSGVLSATWNLKAQKLTLVYSFFSLFKIFGSSFSTFPFTNSTF